MTDFTTALETHLQSELGRELFGLTDVVHGLTIALLGQGHVLLEGPPGLGKTRLSRSFAEVLGGKFKRIQGTADLMPTDMTGVHVFNAAASEFEFQAGPLFADVVLVDEINRAGPKTQSALLEAMEERQVTVDRDTFALAPDFMVVATQNPREYEGTFPLPESQLDRFALCIEMSYLEREQEARVIEAYNLPVAVDTVASVLAPLPIGALVSARQALANVHLASDLVEYLLDLAAATRESSSVNLGLSSRGLLALARSARIEAYLRGGDYVVPDDVQRVAPWVIPHRLVLTAEAAIDGLSATDVVGRLLENVAVPL